MRFPNSLFLLCFGVLAGTVSAETGFINAPPNGAIISPGDIFDYSYAELQDCHQGFTPVTVWLVSIPPTLSQLNSSGEFNPGDFLNFFGSFATPTLSSKLLE